MRQLPILCPIGVEKTLPANELTLKKDDIFLLSSMGFLCLFIWLSEFTPTCVSVVFVYVELQKKKKMNNNNNSHLSDDSFCWLFP